MHKFGLIFMQLHCDNNNNKEHGRPAAGRSPAAARSAPRCAPRRGPPPPRYYGAQGPALAITVRGACF